MTREQNIKKVEKVKRILSKITELMEDGDDYDHLLQEALNLLESIN